MAIYQDVVQDRNGNVIAGATVTVYDAGTTDLAAIFEVDGVTAMDNPTTTDVNGEFEFFVAAGTYDIKVTKTGIVDTTDTNVEIGTGGGGATPDVVFTLSTVPGHGIVPDVTVADYTALDTYLGGTPGTDIWIEVTAGEDIGGTVYSPLLFYRSADPVLFGPFHSWFKNPRYYLGQNDEDVLEVDWYGDGSQSSANGRLANSTRNLNVDLSVENPYSPTDNVWQNKRAQRFPVIYTRSTEFPVGTTRRVRNSASSSSGRFFVFASSEEGSDNSLSAIFNGDHFAAGELTSSPNMIWDEGWVEFSYDATRTVRLTDASHEYINGLYTEAAPRFDGSQALSVVLDQSNGDIYYSNVDIDGSSGGTGTLAGGVLYFDLSGGRRHFTYTFTGATTLAFVRDAPFGSSLYPFLLEMTNAGANALTWPAGTRFAGGAEPAWTAAGTDLAAGFFDGSTLTIVRIGENIGVPA